MRLPRGFLMRSQSVTEQNTIQRLWKRRKETHMALPNITITNGTLVADPETRDANGKAVVSFRVATNSRRKNQQGEWENADSTFLNVTAWEGLGENVAAQFSKGDKVNVTGRLKQRDVEKDGQKRTFYDVTADEVAAPVSRFNDGGQKSGGFGSAPAADPFSGGSDEPPF